MLTAEPNVAHKGQGSAGFAEFRRELVRRFFNPKSYFFLCLSTQLENASSVAADLDEDDYLLIGQTMDALVNEENLFDKLEELSVLARFRDFYDSLEEGVRHLREGAPTAEEMKHTIEGMAHSLVEALIDILQTPESRDHLVEILNTQPSPEGPAAIDINESVVEKHLLFAEREATPTVETAASAVAQPAPPSKTERAPGSDLVEKEPVVEPLPVAGGREPMALQEYAQRQTKTMITAVGSMLRAISAKPGSRQPWSKLCRQLQGLRETAMIHGMEDLESLAFKGWRLLEVRARLSPFPRSRAWTQLYEQLADALHLTLKADAGQKLSGELSRLAGTFKMLIAHPEKIDELVVLPSSPRAADEQAAATATPVAADLNQLKLPGDDDQELIKLVREVRQERERQFEIPTMGQSEASRDDQSLSGRTPDGAKNGGAASSDKTRRAFALAHFQEESELYFEIAEEAIQNLFGNASSRLALDSLELGAYSLKVAARKLGLEPLARFPEHVEELVKRVIAKGVSLEETPLRIISDGLATLKQAERFEDLETPAMRQLTTQILRLAKSIEGVAGKPPSAQRAGEAVPAADRVEATAPDGSFRPSVEEKESKEGANLDASPSVRQPPRFRDSIDFLMVDDSDSDSE